MEETDFKNTAYKAIIGELQEAEFKGKYKGNSHHLAQRLCDMLWGSFERPLAVDREAAHQRGLEGKTI